MRPQCGRHDAHPGSLQPPLPRAKSRSAVSCGKRSEPVEASARRLAVPQAGRRVKPRRPPPSDLRRQPHYPVGIERLRELASIAGQHGARAARRTRDRLTSAERRARDRSVSSSYSSTLSNARGRSTDSTRPRVNPAASSSILQGAPGPRQREHRPGVVGIGLLGVPELDQRVASGSSPTGSRGGPSQTASAIRPPGRSTRRHLLQRRRSGSTVSIIPQRHRTASTLGGRRDRSTRARAG